MKWTSKYSRDVITLLLKLTYHCKIYQVAQIQVMWHVAPCQCNWLHCLQQKLTSYTATSTNALLNIWWKACDQELHYHKSMTWRVRRKKQRPFQVEHGSQSAPDWLYLNPCEGLIGNLCSCRDSTKINLRYITIEKNKEAFVSLLCQKLHFGEGNCVFLTDCTED